MKCNINSIIPIKQISIVFLVSDILSKFVTLAGSKKVKENPRHYFSVSDSRIMASSSSIQPQVPQQPQVQQQQPFHIEVHAQASMVEQAVRWIFKILFYMQLFLISVLVIFITSYVSYLNF